MIEELFYELSQLPQVEAIALGGSRAGNHFDSKSDYDVYLYCINPIPEAIRRQVLSQFCSYMEIGNHFWEYEDNCVLTCGTDIDILYRNLNDFTEDVADVVEHCHGRNGYTTCMWHNLLTCKIIYDRDGRLMATKNRFKVPYPEALRDDVVDRNWRLLRTSMPAYEGQIRKALDRKDLISVNHRISAFLESYFDILFAWNRQTHPGEKRLISLATQMCPSLPEDFEESLNALFAHLYTIPEAVPADLDQLLNALAKLLKK